MVVGRIPFIIRLIMPILWYGLIFYLTELPAASSDNTSSSVKQATAPLFEALSGQTLMPDETNPIADVINAVFRIAAHIFVFGVLGLLFYFLIEPKMDFSFNKLLIVVFLIGLFGLSDEIHQSYVPGRHAALLDVFKDMIGAILFVSAIGFLKLKYFSFKYDEPNK